MVSSPARRSVLATVVALAVAWGPAAVGASPTAGAPVGAGGSPGRFHPPITSALRVVTPFDPPARRWLPGHRGVDLGVSPEEVVVAPADGVVAFAGAVAGRPVLSIDHGHGLRTTYEPVSATVPVGTSVGSGDVVGVVLPGHPGCPVVACLHWGARVDGGPAGDDDMVYIDPTSLLSPEGRPIALKPTLPGDGAG